MNHRIEISLLMVSLMMVSMTIIGTVQESEAYYTTQATVALVDADGNYTHIYPEATVYPDSESNTGESFRVTLTLPGNISVQEGRTFAGWKDYDGNTYNPGEVTITGHYQGAIWLSFEEVWEDADPSPSVLTFESSPGGGDRALHRTITPGFSCCRGPVEGRIVTLTA